MGGSFYSYVTVYQRVNLHFPMVNPMIIPIIPFLKRPACRAARAVSRAEVASPGGGRSLFTVNMYLYKYKLYHFISFTLILQQCVCIFDYIYMCVCVFIYLFTHLFIYLSYITVYNMIHQNSTWCKPARKNVDGKLWEGTSIESSFLTDLAKELIICVIWMHSLDHPMDIPCWNNQWFSDGR